MGLGQEMGVEVGQKLVLRSMDEAVFAATGRNGRQGAAAAAGERRRGGPTIIIIVVDPPLPLRPLAGRENQSDDLTTAISCVLKSAGRVCKESERETALPKARSRTQTDRSVAREDHLATAGLHAALRRIAKPLIDLT